MTAHVLGLDLGLARAGAARITREQHVSTAQLVTPAVACTEGHRKCDEHEPDITAVARRIQKVAAWAVGWASPSTVLAVIEKPVFAAAERSGATDERSGVWWAVACALTQHRIPIAVVANNTAKAYVAGNGRASKDDVRTAVLSCYPRQPELRGMEFDEADAVALAMCGGDWLGWDGPWLGGRRGAGWLKVGRWPRREDVKV